MDSETLAAAARSDNWKQITFWVQDGLCTATNRNGTPLDVAPFRIDLAGLRRLVKELRAAGFRVAAKTR